MPCYVQGLGSWYNQKQTTGAAWVASNNAGVLFCCAWRRHLWLALQWGILSILYILQRMQVTCGSLSIQSLLVHLPTLPLQGIFQAAYVGVGQGLGSLLGGLLMARYGSQLMFVQLSLAIAAGWLISLVAGWALKAAGRRQAAGTLAATCSSTISTSGQTD